MSLHEVYGSTTSGVTCFVRFLAACKKADSGTCTHTQIVSIYDKANHNGLVLTKGALISAFMVNSAASWHNADISAPEHPSVCIGEAVNEEDP